MVGPTDAHRATRYGDANGRETGSQVWIPNRTSAARKSVMPCQMFESSWKPSSAVICDTP